MSNPISQETDRRVAEIQRRREDRNVCALHDLLQDETKDHRKLVCDKIAAKADGSELKGIKTLITVLVTIVCLVVAGQAAWLLSGIHEVKQEAVEAVKSTNAKLDAGFATLHRRITENTDSASEEREVIKAQLGSIVVQQAVTNHRLTQIEEKQKVK